MGWEIHPDGLRSAGADRRDYAPPAIAITENGAAFEDVVGQRIEDGDRLAYLASTSPPAEAIDEAFRSGTSPGRSSTTSSGPWLRDPVRHRARRLRDPAPHDQGQRPWYRALIAAAPR